MKHNRRAIPHVKAFRYQNKVCKRQKIIANVKKSGQ